MKKIIIPAFCAIALMGSASLATASDTSTYETPRSLAERTMDATNHIHKDMRDMDPHFIGVI